MENTFLDFCEIIIPILFLFFTHFVDEKIHEHWKIHNYSPSKTVRKIYLYQWELCFLVISLLFMLGIKLSNSSFTVLSTNWKIGDITLYIVVLSFIFLLLAAFLFISDQTPKMSALPIYIAYWVYGIYVLEYLHYYIRVMPLMVYSYAAFLFIIFGFLVWYLNGLLFIAILKLGYPHWNERVYKHRMTGKEKKYEAIYMILEDYIKENNQQKINEWIKMGEKDFPTKITEIKKMLKIK